VLKLVLTWNLLNYICHTYFCFIEANRELGDRKINKILNKSNLMNPKTFISCKSFQWYVYCMHTKFVAETSPTQNQLSKFTMNSHETLVSYDFYKSDYFTSSHYVDLVCLVLRYVISTLQFWMSHWVYIYFSSTNINVSVRADK
jgi:hypothetical protein